MKTTLQELFLKSGGNPIKIGQREVVQLSRIPISNGVIRLKILSPPDVTQGVTMKAKNGTLELSDGSFAESVSVWHKPGLPSVVTHRVNCPDKELLIWNMYQVQHPTGEITEDYWTGNAGMTLLDSAPKRLRYGCSDWKGFFDPSAMEFEVEWEEGA